ncbi:hypothetical protein DPMN_071660 [Dreissena polymorpha]|uniref:Uncharacterized protein n=1 Tax=Dreissena polymorpha TaxID=45954 RepID=A0A9D3Z2Q5_DREPO|nr:hypothetical protein DPMN_071660 [Dreissena polymorpha]
MSRCGNETGPNMFFHLKCVGLTDDFLSDTWFCSAALRTQYVESINCICKRKRTDTPIMGAAIYFSRAVYGFI